MMQNILVPTDFSNNAYHALGYATQLFKNRECNFFLLNVHSARFSPKNNTNGEGVELDGERVEKSKARLERTVNRIKKDKENSKHSYRLISKNGAFNEVVRSIIVELEIDLIVMGNKGKKSSIPIFLGSTTTKALETLKKCPVLTVPKDFKFRVTSEMAFATDCKRPFGTNVIEPLRSMAILTGAAIRIVHIGEEEKLDEFQRSNLNKLLAHLNPVTHSVSWMPNFISKTKIIQIFLEDSAIDMLAMVNYEHSFLERILREPIIEKMVFNIEIPFLVIPSTD